MDYENNPLGRPDERTQYPEEAVHPLDWAKSKSARLGLIRFGRVHHYRIHTLNAPGSSPAVNGQPPFVVTPYTISPEYRDTNGSLGAYEWTQLPQFVADTRYAVPHRAFVTRKPTNLAITATRLPKVTEIFREDAGELLVIDRQFLVKVREQSEAIRGAFHSFRVSFERLEWTPASSFRALGTEWVGLMERAERPFSPIALRCWTHDVRRRMLDALAFLEFSLRQLIHHALYLGGYEQPRWPTESRFVGVIVSESDDKAMLYRKEIASLGAPVWTAELKNQKPPLQVMPPGAARNHPICKGIWNWASERHNTTREEGRQQAEKEYEKEMERWAKELRGRGHATAEEIWWIKDRNSRQELPPGPRYVDPKGTPTPSRSGIKGLFAAHILAHVRLDTPAGEHDPEFRKGLSMADRVQRRAAFLSNTFGPSIIPHRARERRDVVPALFQDNRRLLQQWSDELFPNLLSSTSPEPSLPEKSITLKLQEWLAEQNENFKLAPELTLALIDRVALPEKEVRSSRVRSPEPEDRRLRRRIEGPEFQEEARDLPETWTNEYASNFRGIALNLATESEERDKPTLPLVKGRYYLVLKDYPYTLPIEQFHKFLYDRYGQSQRGASSYQVSKGSDETLFDLTLQFERGQEFAIRTIVTNQARASQWFPSREPRQVYLATRPDQVRECQPWDPVVADEFRLDSKQRDDERRERFMREGLPKIPHAFAVTLLGNRMDGRAALQERLEGRFNIILPTLNRSLSRSFSNTNRVDYPNGSSYIVMTRYRMAPCVFMDLLAMQIQDIKQRTPLNLGGQLHPLDLLRRTLEGLMGQLVPTPFHIPIPVEGYYREVLEGVASRYKATNASSSLSRGTYADEMFIYESSRAEFEITLCDFEWSDLFDAALP